ncbi:PREDICTED: uncharacterized protein LOC108566434 [Nicrophorus vespilloides]|uniref:Uncharacterized protein LOC108566434 n=1 Tax=Nicrophorus vespilloides TaxID=110193 RepID=A0ABM1N4P1_NICVS|nr:PREDICTED: uncharacterized protein LOC108566434 [Nicrophorus vespilloides]
MFGLYEIVVLFSSILTVILVKKFTEEKSPSICNVYKRCDAFYWPKFVIFYCIFTLLKLINFQKQYKHFDKAQRLPKTSKAFDEVSFSCSNNSGEFIVCDVSRRGDSSVDGMMAIKLKNSRLLRTNLKSASSNDSFKVEGIKVCPVEQGKKWKIIYDGQMKDDAGKMLPCKIDLDYSSDYPLFSYEKHANSVLFADSLAREDWSLNYFKNLQFLHQTHYEQHGDVRGVIRIGDKTENVSLNALRDHSFGKQRDWSQFHRYVLHYINVDNGDKISVGSISMPIAFSNLSVGHVFEAKTGKMQSISKSDFKLYQHGEDGVPPKDYAFTIKLGKVTYVIEVEVEEGFEYYRGNNEVKMIENSCKFRVNGRRAWGSIEWLYRHVE